jgi:uncharacterized protein YjbI with pentapeptide repeats
MLAIALTLAATMIASTDEAILRDSSEVLLSLGIKAKLSTTYLVAPVIFAFMHINALLQLYLLRNRLVGVEQEMQRQRLRPIERIRWRRLVHGFAFAQALLGSDGHHDRDWEERIHRTLLVAMSWLAIVAAPLTLLVTAQVSFVRYQSEPITFVHQLILLVDIALLFLFYSKIGPSLTQLSIKTMVGRFLSFICIVLLLWLSWSQAVPPKEDEDVQAVHGSDDDAGKPNHRSYLVPWISKALVPALVGRANLLDRCTTVTSWLWCRRYLDLSKRTLINGDAKPELLKAFTLDNGEGTAMQRQMIVLDLRYRSLRFAKFTDAQLFSADLRNIRAAKSNWDAARLNGALLDDSDLHEGTLSKAQMQGASLVNANLQGANVSAANLIGANLRSSNLRATDMSESVLKGASLELAHMQAAYLNGANLQGTTMFGADLQSAILSKVRMNNTSGEVANCRGTIITMLGEPQDALDALLTELRNAGVSDGAIAKIRTGKPGNTPNGIAPDHPSIATCGRTRLDGLDVPDEVYYRSIWVETAIAFPYIGKNIEIISRHFGHR